MSEEIITHTAEETIRWGREFSKRLKAPVLVLLTGDLDMPVVPPGVMTASKPIDVPGLVALLRLAVG